MSFSGFVFDMIQRDKQNRDLRNLRRERLSQRQEKMHKGRSGMPQNTTAEDMKLIQKLTVEKEQSDLRGNARMTLIILGICLVVASLLVFIYI